MAVAQLPAQLTVGTARSAVSYTAQDNPRGFQLLIDPGNAGEVYFGGITVTTANGFRLPPGSAYFFTPARIEQIGGTVYLVATADGQLAYADPQ